MFKELKFIYISKQVAKGRSPLLAFLRSFQSYLLFLLVSFLVTAITAVYSPWDIEINGIIGALFMFIGGAVPTYWSRSLYKHNIENNNLQYRITLGSSYRAFFTAIVIGSVVWSFVACGIGLMYCLVSIHGYDLLIIKFYLLLAVSGIFCMAVQFILFGVMKSKTLGDVIGSLLVIGIAWVPLDVMSGFDLKNADLSEHFLNSDWYYLPVILLGSSIIAFEFIIPNMDWMRHNEAVVNNAPMI